MDLNTPALLETLGIGLRFDLRLAVLILLPLVLHEGTFPIIGGVTKDFLLQMQHDGSSPTQHDLAAQTPRDDVAEQHPDEYQRLKGLTRGLHEPARLMLFRNVRE